MYHQRLIAQRADGAGRSNNIRASVGGRGLAVALLNKRLPTGLA